MPFIYITHRKFRELVERVDEIENSMKSIDLEWSSVYDKFRSIVARMAKRQEREGPQAPEPDAESQEASGGAGTQPDASFLGAGLTAHQKAIQQKILKRRAGIQ